MLDARPAGDGIALAFCGQSDIRDSDGFPWLLSELGASRDDVPVARSQAQLW